jgi:hypothetical protein
VAETDPGLRRIERYSVVACAALAVAAGIITRQVDAPLGVVGGGALVAISYRGIKAGISAVVDAAADSKDSRNSRGASAEGRGGSRGVAVGLVKFFTRYAILAFAAYVIMARLRLPPVAVLAGASSLVIAVMAEALRGLSRRA